MEPRDRLIFAADVDSLDALKSYIGKFGDRLRVVKLGMELLSYAVITGEPIVKYVLEETSLKIMWDLKYDDIKKTVAGAARMIAKYGQGRILGFTVHCNAGREALREAVQAVKENFTGPGDLPMVIGITVLTSLSQKDLDELGIKGTPAEVVERWASIANEEGVPAIVCSSKETAIVKKVNPNLIVINPGISFGGIQRTSQDPGRTDTPEGARRNGADFIVMGSHLRDGDPAANADRATAELFSADYKSLSREDILGIFGEMNAIHDDKHFVYKAGGHGKAYVNKDDIYKNPDALEKLCTEIAYRSRNMGVQVVCGPTVGGVLVSNYVAKALRRFTGNPNIVAVFADEENGVRVLKRGYDREVKCKRVLIVEDVINSGDSAAKTCRAVEKAEGDIVGCYSLCNRGKDKYAASQLINVKNQSALLELEMDNQEESECTYCAEGRPIVQDLGHGKAYLVKLSETDPGKAERLGWKK